MALGSCKNEVEFQNEIVKKLHAVLNENDATKIGKVTDLLESFKKEPQPAEQPVKAAAAQTQQKQAQPTGN